MRYWKIDYSAVHDGPGMRTAVFFKGCPMRCLWCANPEGQTKKNTLLYREDRCIGCHTCALNCPERAISFEPGEKRAFIDRSACSLCGRCGDLCSRQAIQLLGQEAGTDDLMRIFEKNRYFYRRTGGGVTFTGGEPLYQGKDLVRLAEQCRDTGIHTVLETCGYAENGLFAEAASAFDWIYFDLKSIDPERHERLTGRSNEGILQNLAAASGILGERGKTLVVRIVVIPGVTDGDNLRDAAVLLKKLPYLSGIELLRYHDLGVHKYGQLSRGYALSSVPAATEADIETGRRIFRESGLSVL